MNITKAINESKESGKLITMTSESNADTMIDEAIRASREGENVDYRVNYGRGEDDEESVVVLRGWTDTDGTRWAVRVELG